MASGADVGRDLAIEVCLPLHLLGDGLDDQVAVAQLLEVLVVVGGVDVGERSLVASGDGSSFFRPSMAFLTMPFGSPSFAGQVEQHDRHVGVGQVRGDLRAHDAGAEHRDLADDEIVHFILLRFQDRRLRAWRAC